ncbi:MAG: competence/damage-inducible protein A [Chloroflexi bacterium]|nr:competence/damage-inducible protein A [Chloroflexota bacterium]MDA1146547.1 competence/damage-inducible protein A [Chloroflexota bacterium]MQC82763.1 competence/damage-inducible protein A [Chloroflexota bacterium]PKB56749.1 MAG: competence/damage-inducible protein A [SAR202 cluster bacterium Casp-Chloro-G1]
MRAEIISIGTEIMLGEITDTNAAFIASQLPEFGIDLLWVSQLGDNPDRLRETFNRAWERSDIIFTTGGLGPTQDDLTREMVAGALGEELYRDADQESHLRQMMESRGRTMPESNLKQANLIASARAISNPRGTAPGWWVERDGKIFVVMPGPPSEMTRMWEHEVVPELDKRAEGILVSRTLKTTGIGEGSVDEMLSPLLAGTNPSIGIYARRDGVHARISAKAATREEAWHLIHPVEDEARRILGASVWGIDEDTLEAAIGRMLIERGLTLGAMESATGGAIADTITNVSGSSEYFKGSLVTYATQAKIAMGVPAEIVAMHGVISREVAEAMADAARARLETDLGIGITGIAGNEEVEGQPPGTMHIALSDGEHIEYSHSQYYQGREAAKRRAALMALTMLRRYLMAERV